MSIVNFDATDIIDLSRIDADTGTGGNQAFTPIGIAPFNGVAGELRYDGVIAEGDVDGDGHPDFRFEIEGASVDPGQWVL